jgi:topoisomerase-4 subunit A
MSKTINQVGVFYENWFLDYASYVILERAVPHIDDGLKPVQRRILHSLYEMDDGRYNKVANVVGHAMRYHPHGDASIYEALVALGQKNFLVETQGNWGNILTGDGAAAARYIEARLSKLAKEAAFNPDLTSTSPSYDGRGREPVALPIKMPLLLLQGVEGIAVGLACKILPHNFIELLNGSIAYLRGENFNIFPDFATGGEVDVTDYNDGRQGGKVKVRAKIELEGKDKLVVTQLPFGTVASSLMESIEKAVLKNKIKIKRIDDYISKTVRIVIQLPSGACQETTRKALYAFTLCESSISVNACVIHNEAPKFLGVSDLLKYSADRTKDLLRRELEIRLERLQEEWHRMKLEEIFIQEKVYQKYEKAESWEAIVDLTEKAMRGFRDKLKRDINEDDIRRLTDIRVKRISRFDEKAAGMALEKNENEQNSTQANLDRINEYTINYYHKLIKEYGGGRERKTTIAQFGSVEAASVAAANVKLYVNKQEGFIGYSLKKDDFICDCSDIDDVLAIGKDGWMKVDKIAPKTYMGPSIVEAGVWRKNDTKIYNMIYRDGDSGVFYVKRFKAGAITRGKVYSLVKSEKSEVIFLKVTEEGKDEKLSVRVILRKQAGVRKTEFEFDFSSVGVKGREAGGNIISRHHVSEVKIIR